MHQSHFWRKLQIIWRKKYNILKGKINTELECRRDLAGKRWRAVGKAHRMGGRDQSGGFRSCGEQEGENSTIVSPD